MKENNLAHDSKKLYQYIVPFLKNIKFALIAKASSKSLCERIANALQAGKSCGELHTNSNAPLVFRCHCFQCFASRGFSYIGLITFGSKKSS